MADPTPYPDVKALLGDLLRQVRAATAAVVRSWWAAPEGIATAHLV